MKIKLDKNSWESYKQKEKFSIEIKLFSPTGTNDRNVDLEIQEIVDSRNKHREFFYNVSLNEFSYEK